MTSEERRKKIQDVLSKNSSPITATALAKKYSVSRQVIVGDIALMRASGLEISATPRGYVLDCAKEEKDFVFTVACYHNEENMRNELYAVVDNGGTILDVTVEHAVYGEISGELRISTRYEADEFMKKIICNDTQPLMRLTKGVHLHRIKCKDKEERDRIIESLKKDGIIFEE